MHEGLVLLLDVLGKLGFEGGIVVQQPFSSLNLLGKTQTELDLAVSEGYAPEEWKAAVRPKAD